MKAKNVTVLNRWIYFSLVCDFDSWNCVIFTKFWFFDIGAEIIFFFFFFVEGYLWGWGGSCQSSDFFNKKLKSKNMFKKKRERKDVTYILKNVTINIKVEIFGLRNELDFLSLFFFFFFKWGWMTGVKRNISFSFSLIFSFPLWGFVLFFLRTSFF